ncbi:hypothetical protein ABZ806_27865 [Spirillospora sp. NPDC047418]
MISDDEEQATSDVDIMDITDPSNPTLIAETSLTDWPGAQKPLANGETVFLHDMVVKKIRGHWLGLLSYWDAGWVILNLDNPAKPVFVNDSDYPDPEKLLGFSPPEGNGHQAEWTRNNRFIVGTDEDFSPTRTSFQITAGPNAGTYGAGQFDWTVQIDTLPGKTFEGAKTVWAGSGAKRTSTATAPVTAPRSRPRRPPAPMSPSSSGAAASSPRRSSPASSPDTTR